MQPDDVGVVQARCDQRNEWNAQRFMALGAEVKNLEERVVALEKETALLEVRLGFYAAAGGTLGGVATAVATAAILRWAGL